MQHIETIRDLGELLGYDIDSRSDAERTDAERILDAVFERGYQAGYQDGWHDPFAKGIKEPV